MAREPRLLIFETTGEWNVAIRWQTGLGTGEVRTLSTLLEARTAIRESPGTLAVLEATRATAEGVWRLIWELRRTCPSARVVVVLDAAVRDLADLFHEVGALWVASSPRRLDRLRSWLVPAGPATPDLQQATAAEVKESLWARLPWGNS